MADEEGEQSSTADASLEGGSTPPGKQRWNLRKRKPAAVQESTAGEGSPPPTPPTTKKRRTDPRVAAGGGGGGGGRRRKLPQPREEAEGEAPVNEGADLLFDAVLAGSSAAKSVASDWVDRYEQDAESAMLELVQYFVLCCGCRGVVTMEMFQEDDTSAIIRKLTENFAEESGDYPLMQSGPIHKKFKANFCELLEHVVSQCQHKVLFDSYMMDTLIVWLVGLTDSQVRAFRHTSTLACLKLVSALITVANDVITDLDNTQRQVDAERKRQQGGRTEEPPQKLKKLIAKKTELQQQRSQLEDTMRGLVSSVFVHRYRDVRPEIRVLCITELGHWLLSYSAYFLEDKYLKYIGWIIHDKNAEVRLSSLRVLETLYSSESTAHHMDLFTERFKERMLSMRLDQDDACARQAIFLLGVLLNLDMLEQEECVEVCELVFFECRAIGQAAGWFASQYLFSDDFMMRARQAKTARKRRKPTDKEIMVVELIRFFIESKVHDHAIYFADSLWDYVPVLKEWDVMTSLLLDDKAGLELKDTDEAALIEIIAATVARSVAVGPPPGRGKAKVVSARDKKTIEENREQFSACLMVTLPQLMTKYGSDAACASSLVSILQHFDLEMFAERRLQKNLEAILTRLQALVLAHHSPEMLGECAKAYKSLMASDSSLLSTVVLGFQQLLDQLAADLQLHCRECRDHLSDEEESFELKAVLSRLEHIARYNDITKWPLTDDLHSLVEAGLSNECCDELLRSAVAIMKSCTFWCLSAINEDHPDRAALRELKARVATLVHDCSELIKFGRELSKREAYISLCDTLVVFSRALRGGQLEGLVYTADAQLQQTLLDYVLTSVLVPDEEEEEEEGREEDVDGPEEHLLEHAMRLNDRRIQLAGFLKLGMYSAVDMTVLSSVFAQYLMQYPNFGDLMKAALGRCREFNPIGWAQTVVFSIKEVFQELAAGGEVDQTSPEWAELRDLARRFALTTGFDVQRAREPLSAVHRLGIQFALSEQHEDDPMVPPPNLSFLLVLSEFTFRLILVEKRSLLQLLHSQLPRGHYQRVEALPEWDALRAYCCNLLPRDDSGRVRLRASAAVVPAAAHRGKRRGGVADEEGRPSKTARLNSSSSDVGSEVNGSSSPAAKAKGK